MSDNRKYYYLKLKENYSDDDSIVLRQPAEAPNGQASPGLPFRHERGPVDPRPAPSKLHSSTLARPAGGLRQDSGRTVQPAM